MENICLTFINIICPPAFTYVTFGWASPRANLANMKNAETECFIFLKLTRYRNPSLSSSCLPSESPPHHGPTSPSSGRLRWFLFSSNISRWFSRFSDQQYRWVKSSASLTEENYLPVGESPLPLTGPSLVLRLDHHHSSLRGTQLQRSLSDASQTAQLTWME